ncbi:hypothetical protein C8R47DRAFT_1076739 [Mycena vitilis]|nr:hypothetical protein C8R47DRAFT_1076739 [Mycena vitilis]
MTSPRASTYSGLKHDDFYPFQLEEKSIPPRSFRLAKRALGLYLLGWPAFVVAGQLDVQAVGWGFLAAVRSRGPLALPLSTAVWASDNPHLVTLIATLISTLLAGCSSFWSTLLTPVKVDISTPLVGREIDLSSADIQQMWATPGNSSCMHSVHRPQFRTRRCNGDSLDSGYANARSYLGLPSTVSFLGQGFSASTGGIVPATLNDTHVGLWSIPRGNGISDSYSMSQQGFTANISCGLQTPTNVTTPNVKVSSYDVGSDEGMNLVHVSVSSNCLGSMDHSYYLWALFCDGATAYILIAQASGISSESNYTTITGSSNTSYLVCQIAPATTIVSANYAGVINVTVESVGPPNSDGGFAGGAGGSFAIYTIWTMVFRQQGLESNSVADQLQGLMNNSVPTDTSLRAVILRGCLLAGGLKLNRKVPASITKPMHGMWTIQTLGWQRYSSGATAWIPIPGLFMACSTLALVLIALYRHGAEMRTDEPTFDPSNPLHLMAAASAGGLNGAFRGLKDRDIHEGGKLTVVLGSVPGRGPALVRVDSIPGSANEYTTSTH